MLRYLKNESRYEKINYIIRITVKNRTDLCRQFFQKIFLTVIYSHFEISVYCYVWHSYDKKNLK